MVAKAQPENKKKQKKWNQTKPSTTKPSNAHTYNPCTKQSLHILAQLDTKYTHYHQFYQTPPTLKELKQPWPVVEDFLGAIPDGSIGADVGCGNGKYLGVNPKLLTIGSDMSSNLVGICAQRGFEAMVCDNLHLPYRTNCFDFVISIAVIHHFSSFERRVAAVKELIRTIRPGGKILIFVWALEQEDGSKRKFEKQDVFVPWNLDAKTFAGKSKSVAANGGRRKGKKNQGQDGQDSAAVVEDKGDTKE
ncbi:hypothetical protein HDU78_010617, partial [Chytriomyces hyalinus]